MGLLDQGKVPCIRLLEEAALMTGLAVRAVIFDGKEPMGGRSGLRVGISAWGMAFWTNASVPLGCSLNG